MAQSSKVTYTQGHHSSITKVHAARTPENSAAFLLPYLTPSMRILDIGCGPGSITCGFSKYVPSGSVVGVEISDSVLAQARASATDLDLDNVSFALGNVSERIPFADDSFDVVFCHQVLFHVADHVSALREMRRLCKAGGMVACREGDFETFVYYPLNRGLKVFLEKYTMMAIRSGMDPQTGRKLHVYAREAGFAPEDIRKSASLVHYASEEERAWYGHLHMERVEKSELRDRFKEMGVSDEELGLMVEGFREWMLDQDGWNAIMNGEIICRC